MEKQEQDKEESGGPLMGSEAASGRILLKLKLQKMAAADEEIDGPEEEMRSHYCQECDKSFSSGKALGGHVSSAHVQANKDQSLKKLKSKMKSQRKGSASVAEILCEECQRNFPSMKALFGHMRCHPDRRYRGMNSPLKLKIGSSSGPELDDVALNQEEEEEEKDEEIDSAGPEPAAGLAKPPLKSWSATGKRGRGQIKPVIDSPPASEEKEVFVAVQQLMRLLKSDPRKQASVEEVKDNSSTLMAAAEPELDDQASEIKKQKKDHSSMEKQKICEEEMESNGKGKEKIGSKGKLKKPENSYNTDSDNQLCLTAIVDLMNGARAERAKVHKDAEKELSPIEQKGGLETSSTLEKYICSTCNKSFPTHQALGGHRSSHKKFKISIVNTRDGCAIGAVTNSGKVVAKNLGANTASYQYGSPIDDDSLHLCKICNKTFPSGQALGGHKRSHSGADERARTAKLVLDIDLNKMPADQQDPDDEDHVVDQSED